MTRPRINLSPPRRPVAKEAPANPLPLGDYVERMLKKAGITEDRYKAAKEAVGLPPTCGCPRVRAWLNEAGKWLAETIRKEQSDG